MRADADSILLTDSKRKFQSDKRISSMLLEKRAVIFDITFGKELFVFIMLGLCGAFTFIPPASKADVTQSPQVIWRITDWPPFYITKGAHKGKGLYDQMIAHYKAALPQFRHATLEMTTMRALQQMKNRQNGLAVCHVSMLKSSLTGFAHVSKLNSILLAHVIIARNKSAAKIRSLSPDNSPFVSIEKLFLHQGLRGAHSSYGTHAVLERFNYLNEPLPNIIMTAENYQNLGQLLLNGRVDYIVQYSPFITFLMGSKNNDGYTLIPILETRKKPYVEVYVGCTKNTIGKKVIAVINSVLDTKARSLQNTRIEWYPQEEKRKLMGFYEELAPTLNDF